MKTQECNHEFKIFHDSNVKGYLTFYCSKCLQFAKKLKPLTQSEYKDYQEVKK